MALPDYSILGSSCLMDKKVESSVVTNISDF